jgi:hypothetical protein
MKILPSSSYRGGSKSSLSRRAAGFSPAGAGELLSQTNVGQASVPRPARNEETIMPYREVVVQKEPPVGRDNSSMVIIGALVVLTLALLMWLFLLRGNTGRVIEDVGPRNVPADSTSEPAQQNAPAQSTQTESNETKGGGSGASSVQTDSGGAEVGVDDTVTQSIPQE